jgi:hypothetical protein
VADIMEAMRILGNKIDMVVEEWEKEILNRLELWIKEYLSAKQYLIHLL